MLNLIHYGIVLLCLAIIGFYVWTMYQNYKTINEQPGDWQGWLEMLWALGRDSATKFWAKIGGLLGALGTLLVTVSPQAESLIKTYLTPGYVTAGLFIFAVIVELARNRTLK